MCTILLGNIESCYLYNYCAAKCNRKRGYLYLLIFNCAFGCFLHVCNTKNFIFNIKQFIFLS